jgi:radical SAM superfamily enzyme with C-terminal helix-hairpin-helix motif
MTIYTIKRRFLLWITFAVVLTMLCACASHVVASSQRVDINSASAAELAKLPKMTEQKIQSIIAGRPWSFAADLVKQQVLIQSEYDVIKDLIVAIQHSPIEGKGEKKKIH